MARKAKTRTRVDLAGDARFIGWEIFCLGRPVVQEQFRNGDLHQDFLLYRDGRPLLLDRLRLSGDSPALASRWGLADAQAMGTMLMYPGAGADLAALRAVRADDARFAMTPGGGRAALPGSGSAGRGHPAPVHRTVAAAAPFPAGSRGAGAADLGNLKKNRPWN